MKRTPSKGEIVEVEVKHSEIVKVENQPILNVLNLFKLWTIDALSFVFNGLIYVCIGFVYPILGFLPLSWLQTLSYPYLARTLAQGVEFAILTFLSFIYFPISFFMFPFWCLSFLSLVFQISEPWATNPQIKDLEYGPVCFKGVIYFIFEYLPELAEDFKYFFKAEYMRSIDDRLSKKCKRTELVKVKNFRDREDSFRLE